MGARGRLVLVRSERASPASDETAAARQERQAAKSDGRRRARADHMLAAELRSTARECPVQLCSGCAGKDRGDRGRFAGFPHSSMRLNENGNGRSSGSSAASSSR
jgi:hypothetical protein